MPVARFQMPDGRIGRFEVPEGTTAEQAQSAITRFLSAGGIAAATEDPAYEQEARNIQQTTPAELAAANPMARVAVGVASPILGAMERLGLRSSEQRKQLEQMQERGNEALRFGAAGVTGDIAGTVLSPAWLGASKAMPVATSLAERVAQSSGLGALSGVTTPTDSPIAAAAGGAVLGGVVPIALATGGKLLNTIRNLHPERRKEAFYAAAGGDKADEIIDLLKRNEQLVPGSAPTAGQAAQPAGRAEFAAIQAAAQRASPSTYNARTDAQSAAQLAQLRGVGKTTQDLETAIAARKAVSDPLYDAARKAGMIEVNPILDNVNKLIRDNSGNRELVVELMNIKRGLKTKTGFKEAQQVASVIDGMKTSMADEKNTFILGRLNDIKASLEKSLPGYEKAQAAFKDASSPINRMQAGQYLEGMATPTGYTQGSGTPLRFDRFLEAVRKSTDVAGDDAAKRAADLFAKRVTGNPRFRELTEVLEPQEMEAVANVTADFIRNREFLKQAASGALAMPQFKETAKLPNLLMREAMVMNAIISKAEAKINAKLAAEIAVEMLNPPKVAGAMQRGVDSAKANKYKAEFLFRWHQRAFPAGYQAAVQETQ